MSSSEIVQIVGFVLCAVLTIIAIMGRRPRGTILLLGLLTLAQAILVAIPG